MSASYAQSREPQRCYNGQNNWQLGWYSEKALAVLPIEGPRLLKVAPFVYYNESPAGIFVLVKVGRDIYLQLNRDEGFNRGTGDMEKQLTVIKDLGGRTNLLAGLDMTVPSFHINNFENSGSQLLIEVCSTTNAADDAPLYMTISLGYEVSLCSSVCRPMAPPYELDGSNTAIINVATPNFNSSVMATLSPPPSWMPSALPANQPTTPSPFPSNSPTEPIATPSLSPRSSGDNQPQSSASPASSPPTSQPTAFSSLPSLLPTTLPSAPPTNQPMEASLLPSSSPTYQSSPGPQDLFTVPDPIRVETADYDPGTPDMLLLSDNDDSIPPEQECQDSTRAILYFQKTIGSMQFVHHQTCDYLQGRLDLQAMYCLKGQAAYDLCPQTCRKCSGPNTPCDDNPLHSFTLHGETRDCTWVRLNPQFNLCVEGSMISSNCRQACGYCNSKSQSSGNTVELEVSITGEASAILGSSSSVPVELGSNTPGEASKIPSGGGVDDTPAY
jgi:hypothetical protein